MSSFTTPLIISPNDDGQTWTLQDPFEYHVGGLGSDWRISVPAGFVTDFASIPRAFWNILPPWGTYGKPAVVHDFLYQAQAYTQVLSDAILFEAMTSIDVVFWKRWTIYGGVRVGGWAAWNQHKRANALKAAGQVPDLIANIVKLGE